MRTVKSFGQEQKPPAGTDIPQNHWLKLKKGLRMSLYSWEQAVPRPMLSRSHSQYGGRQVVNAEITVGDLTQFLLYMVIVASSVATLGGLFTDLMTALGAARQVFELMEEEPEKAVRKTLP